jgi:predicted enzyme related to lactoylglutathione lyase
MSDNTTTQPATPTAGPAAPPVGGVAWFEIGTDEPARVQAFYGGLFGWRFEPDTTTGMDYRIVTTGEGHPLQGGVWNTAGRLPHYAVFATLVADVPAACARAEELGGKVLVAPITAESGLVFAHLLDPDGNQFGVFAPPAG